MHCRKKRLVLSVLVCAVIYICFKILTTEIDGTRFSDLENHEMKKLNLKHHIEGKHSYKMHSHNKSTDIGKDEIVSELVNKYSLNFKYPIRESPWSIAKSWVSENHVHPEFTPELGKFKTFF